MTILKHILVIAELFPPDIGGGASRASNVVKGLSLKGYQTTVVSAFPHYPLGQIPRDYRWRLISVESDSSCRLVRVFVPPLPSKGFMNRMLLFISFCFASLLAYPYSKGIDCVWAANPNIISFFPAIVYAFLRRCPVVLNVDDLWPEAPVQLGMMRSDLIVKVAEFIAGFTYRMAEAITPISPGYVDVITRKYHIEPEKVHVVLGGVDLDTFKAVKKERKDSFFSVLYIGSFSTAYDFHCVLKAAERLKGYEDIRFVLQGAGEMSDFLQSQVRETGLGNVEVVVKTVSRVEVANLLQEADVLLLPLGDSPSVQMGISSKLYEYQASGKPIICCSFGEPARYIQETKSGVVVEPGDHQGLGDAILNLYQDEDKRRELGSSGLAYVSTRASCEAVGEKMSEVFKKCLLNENDEAN